MNTITYEYHKSLYVNLTNRCNCRCTFCLRHNGAGGSIYADNLWLDHEPTPEEALEDLLQRNLPCYEELIFCGFGEPTYRLDVVLWLVDRLKEQVVGLPPVRINTNGHANLILGRDVTPELAGRIDTLSISLNGSTKESYLEVTRPKEGAVAWGSMLDFIKKSSDYVGQVVLTVVDKDKSPEELAQCETLAKDLGATLRIRHYIED